VDQRFSIIGGELIESEVLETPDDFLDVIQSIKSGRDRIGNANQGGKPEWGLALQGFALTFADPRPPALIPIVLPIFRSTKQYGKWGLVQWGY
jgi:hypothetical protein